MTSDTSSRFAFLVQIPLVVAPCSTFCFSTANLSNALPESVIEAATLDTWTERRFDDACRQLRFSTDDRGLPVVISLQRSVYMPSRLISPTVHLWLWLWPNTTQNDTTRHDTILACRVEFVSQHAERQFFLMFLRKVPI